MKRLYAPFSLLLLSVIACHPQSHPPSNHTDKMAIPLEAAPPAPASEKGPRVSLVGVTPPSLPASVSPTSGLVSELTTDERRLLSDAIVGLAPSLIPPPLALFNNTGAPFGDPMHPPAPSAQVSLPLQVETVTPQGLTQQNSVITITFNQSMMTTPPTGPVDALEVPVVITPDTPGQWHWLGNRTLIFESTDPLLIATDYKVDVLEGSLSSVSGAALDATLSSQFHTASPQVVAVTATQKPGQDTQITVVFDQAIDSAAATEHMGLKVGEDPLNFHVDAGGAFHPQRLTLIPDTPLPPETSVTVLVKQGLPPLVGSRRHPTPQSFEIVTKPALKILSWGCLFDEPCHPQDDIVVTFNHELDPTSLPKHRVHIEPGMDNATVRLTGQRMVIKGNTQPLETYTLSIPGGIQDIYGQPLGHLHTLNIPIGTSKAEITPDERPIVTIPKGDNPHFAIHSRGIEALRIQVYAVSPKDHSAYRSLRWRLKKGEAIDITWPKIGDITQAVPAPWATSQRAEIALSKYAQANSGGTHLLVSVAGIDHPETRSLQWLTLSDLSLHTWREASKLHVWVTALSSGLPAKGVDLTLGEAATATTNDDGYAFFEGDSLKGPLSAILGDDSAFLPKLPKLTPVRPELPTVKSAIPKSQFDPIGLTLTPSEKVIFQESRATIDLQATYAGHIHLQNQDLEWTVLAEDKPFSPEGWPGFSFHPLFKDSPHQGSAQHLSGKTNAKGQLSLQLEATTKRRNTAVSLTIGSRIFRKDQVLATADLSTLAHPKLGYVGLNLASQFVSEGRPQSLQVILVSPEGQPILGQGVTVKIIRDGSGSKDKPITLLFKGQSKKSPTSLTMPGLSPGNYKAVVYLYDGDKQVRYTAASFRVLASEEANLGAGLSLLANKSTYKGGDTLELLLESDLKMASGLALVTTSLGTAPIAFDAAGTSHLLRIPLEASFSPPFNIQVTTTLQPNNGTGLTVLDASLYQTGSNLLPLQHTAASIRSMPVVPPSNTLRADTEMIAKSDAVAGKTVQPTPTIERINPHLPYVRVDMPQHLIAGDVAHAAITLENPEPTPITLQIFWQGQGLILDEDTLGMSVVLPPNRSHRIPISLETSHPGQHFLAVAVAINALPATASQSAITVLPRLSSEDHQLASALYLTAPSTLNFALFDPLLHLLQVPNPGAETLASRIIALTKNSDRVPTLGLPTLDDADSVKARIESDVLALLTLQNSRGGLSPWASFQTPDAFLSVHGAHALILAAKNGFSVPYSGLHRARAYLRTLGTHALELNPLERDSLLAYGLYIEAVDGQNRVPLKNDEGAAAPKSRPIAYSAWMLAALAPQGDSTTAPYRQYIEDQTHLDSTSGHMTPLGLRAGRRLIFSDTRQDALALIALLLTSPDHELIPPLLEGLLEPKSFVSTQEVAFIALAIDAYLSVFPATADAPLQGPSNTELTPIPPQRGTILRRYVGLDDPEDVSLHTDGTWHIKQGARVGVILNLAHPGGAVYTTIKDGLPKGLLGLDWPGEGAMDAFTHADISPSGVFIAEKDLKTGTYRYQYEAVATTPGQFTAPAPTLNAPYGPGPLAVGLKDVVFIQNTQR